MTCFFRDTSRLENNTTTPQLFPVIQSLCELAYKEASGCWPDNQEVLDTFRLSDLLLNLLTCKVRFDQ